MDSIFGFAYNFYRKHPAYKMSNGLENYAVGAPLFFICIVLYGLLHCLGLLKALSIEILVLITVLIYLCLLMRYTNKERIIKIENKWDSDSAFRKKGYFIAIGASVTAILLFFCGCQENVGSQIPFDCKLVEIKTEYKSLETEYFELEIPKEWDCERSVANDGTINYICFDTVLLYSKEVNRSITVSEYDFEQFESKTFMLKLIERYKKLHPQTFSDSGQQQIGEQYIYWASFQDSSSYSVVYHLFGKNYTLINIIDPLNNSKLCETLYYIQTLKRK